MQSIPINGSTGIIHQNLLHAGRAARPDHLLVVVAGAANVRSRKRLICQSQYEVRRGDIRDAALMPRLFQIAV